MTAKTKRIVVGLLLAVFCLSLGLFAACATPAESVTLNKKSATLNVGESITLSATVLPEKAVETSVLQWSSSNEAVAKVENGKVTAISKGSATITVTIAETELSATCQVEVLLPVGGVTLSETQKVLNVGDDFQLEATVSPEGASNPAISWSSSNEAVATVANGVVTAVGKGSAVITVTCSDGGHTATCTVSVLMPVSSVEIQQDDTEMFAGKTLVLNANVLPSDASNKNVSWSSSNDEVAKVNANGIVTAVGKGEATITVTTEDGNFTDSITVTVLDFDTKPAELTASAQLAQGHVVVGSPANSIATVNSPIDGTIYYVMGEDDYTRSQLINNENVLSAQVNEGSNMILLHVANQSVTKVQYVIVAKGEISTETPTTDVLSLQWTSNEFYVLPETGAITTWAQLKEALKVDQDVVLGANIDAEGEDYTPTLSDFSHTFDGAGYYIFNLNVVATENNAGLYKTARTPAEFKNVTFVNATINANAEYVGLLFGSNAEPANNVIVINGVNTINLQVNGDKNCVGALVGWIKGATADVTFANCNVDMVVNGYTGERLGGLFGLTNYNSKISIENCHGNVKLNEVTKNYFGGLIGQADASDMQISITNSSGVVESNSCTANNVGGLIGRLNGPQATVTNCEATVVANNCASGDYYGGLIGAIDGQTVLSATNTISTFMQNGSKLNRTGGFAGGAFGSCTVNVQASAMAFRTDGEGEGDERKGGFIGQTNTNANMTLENCAIYVEINKTMTAFGGFIGAIDGSSKLHTNLVLLSMNVNGTIAASNDAFGYYGGVAEEDGVIIENTVMQSNFRPEGDLVYGQLWNAPAEPVLENSVRTGLGESVDAEIGSLFVAEQNEHANFWNYDAQTGTLQQAAQDE